MKKTHTYKPGDPVRIARNVSDHNFKAGQEVVLGDFDGRHWTVFNLDKSFFGFFLESEIEPTEESVNPSTSYQKIEISEYIYIEVEDGDINICSTFGREPWNPKRIRLAYDEQDKFKQAINKAIN